MPNAQSQKGTFDFHHTMTNSNDPLEQLEAKLLKVVELFKRTQAERRALQQEVDKLRADLKEPLKRAHALEQELQALRRERDSVRVRVEKLLEQIEALTTSESAG
jgi:chromosome segregation ATPase